MPRFSLVIPAYNEELLLPRLLDTVEVARRSYRGGPQEVEIVVADNGSTDRTVEIARTAGAVVAQVEPRIIAAVRNGGAAVASGDHLCFIDADSRLHPLTFDALDDALDDPKIVGGATGVRLKRWSLGLTVTFAVVVPFVVMSRMDTGVVFCRREDFETIGGYNESRRFAEDLEFIWNLRRLGKARGQRLVRLTGVKAITSTRKFDTHGDWHYLTQLPRLLPMMFRSPEGISDWARAYWYEDR
ncbi:MAG: glycosyltransferase [Thermoanaerobaculia bacterium]|nr:glycosyltransferase [Thermoanaerobaculia bacterium]